MEPHHETYFVDVIIPIRLPRLLTYRVPRELNEEVQVGRRVIVQLGRAKMYTALIHTIHQKAPEKYTAKYLEAVLDAHPIIHRQQLALWEWMKAYYMCTLGEVMQASIPSSMKLASETKLVLNDQFDGEVSELNERELTVLDALQMQEILSLKEVSELLGVKTVQPIIKSLVERGVVTTEEELRRRYKPKMEKYLDLADGYKSESALNDLLNGIEKRAPKQADAMMAFLQEVDIAAEIPITLKKKALTQNEQVSPAAINALVKKGVFLEREEQIGRLPNNVAPTQPIPELSEHQLVALNETEQLFEEKDCVLLHGVTSSGKTEVYAHLIQKALEQGKQVLFLVPEIALTTQLISRLKAYFGMRVGVFHSKFNPNERAEIWNDVLLRKKGKYDIILGARSALMLPFCNLGLIIVDEEHETSYKQYDPAPRYNARDSAHVLAEIHGAKVLLGSATPSLESYHNAVNQRYGLVEMTKRFGDVVLPEIVCADVAEANKTKTMKGIFTPMLLDEIARVLQQKKQVILFQNRRGYAALWQCSQCGHVPQCKRCDVSLTYHKRAHDLKCHYCGYSVTPPKECDACHNHDLRMVGSGTEKIEEELSIYFPDAQIARMDLDTTRNKNAYEQLITDFQDKRIDILTGTQMVTKGLDFDDVALVGIINADLMLKFPDFRAGERAYQLMAQVSGRAGRRGDRGKVVIQTHTPFHHIIRKVMENDYKGMFEGEMEERKTFYYPPFYRLIRITLKHKDFSTTHEASHFLADLMKKVFGQRVLGPEAPLVPRINNQFLSQITLKMEKKASPASVKSLLRKELGILIRESAFKSVRVVIDVDPV